MKTYNKPGKSPATKTYTPRPYPYCVTYNKVLLALLLEGFKLTQTVLRVDETGLVADVTLVKGEETKHLYGLAPKDTPVGRKALRDAEAVKEEKPVTKKVRVGKTAKDRGGKSTETIVAQHKKALRQKSAEATNQQASSKKSDGSAMSLGKKQKK